MEDTESQGLLVVASDKSVESEQTCSTTFIAA